MKFYRAATVRIRIRNANFNGYVTTITLSGLRVSFSITKSLAWSTNSCIVKIWNLSQDHRNLIKDYGDEVTVYANYSNSGVPNAKATEVLFVGDTTAVSHIFDQPEIVTVLECGDGDKYLNQLRVNLSYAADTPARVIINGIASQMGIDIAEYAASDNLVYRQGFKHNAMGKEALDIVCAKLGLQVSVQNGALQIIPLNGTISQPAIQINEQTGMQGIPQRFTYRRLFLYKATDAPTTGYKVNVALNPFITPGSKIDLSSTHLNFRGPYRVENVRHDGDTYGFVWSSNIECTELATGATQ
jgi:hypothetical protein